MFSIGKLSRKTNLSVRTLRYYDEIDLLKPAKVADTGYRYYGVDEIKKLQHITALKELGFTLTSIKEILSSEEEGKESRWRGYLEFELGAVAEQQRKLAEMERLLQLTRHALEMKSEVNPEDIFLFVKAIQLPTINRQAFRDLYFKEDEINILENLPDLSTADPRNMQWAKLIRDVKANLHEPPDSETSQSLAKQILEMGNEWFQKDEQLIDKYWGLIRPEEGEKPKVYGMDAEVMNYIDRIVDWHLENNKGEEKKDE
ncbi:MerR family transcriptional regulator [Cytobacillus purgationiresistens]|uniref:DNA-binding transcriptional MerR regulator n=1 Tax=Cytobacillus purgationiresistens TaxID=863449 RepID=A0ABU0AMY9_9BACI|nr:MerR family transcriptional regulator [Cytobacillus purgationiresistens]MDQ0272639.1 DNA-binding transcriptional MerR regulator [Cytobacillus purgationiresistens]